MVLTDKKPLCPVLAHLFSFGSNVDLTAESIHLLPYSELGNKKRFPWKENFGFSSLEIYIEKAKFRVRVSK